MAAILSRPRCVQHWWCDTVWVPYTSLPSAQVVFAQMNLSFSDTKLWWYFVCMDNKWPVRCFATHKTSLKCILVIKLGRMIGTYVLWSKNCSHSLSRFYDFIYFRRRMALNYQGDVTRTSRLLISTTYPLYLQTRYSGKYRVYTDKAIFEHEIHLFH